MTQRTSDALLVRFLTGDCTPSEECEITAQIAADPAFAQRVEEGRRALFPASDSAAWDVDAMWRTLHDATVARDVSLVPASRLVEPLVPGVPTPRAHRALPGSFPKSSHSMRRVAAVAASVAAVIVGGRAAGLHFPVAPVLAPTPEAPREYSTGRGERAIITLADGSSVTLAAESKLTISPGFGKGAREMQLEGEAFFDVVHDTAATFRVFAGGALIEDAGTQFDVRAYRSDSMVAVAVTQGSVMLSPAPAPGATLVENRANTSIMLLHGERGTLDSRGTVRATKGQRLARYLAWRDGRLSFSDEPLTTVLSSVARWYDVDVRVSDSRLGARPVTAEFSTSTQSAPEMVDALAAAVDARVVRNGGTITLTRVAP